MRTAAAVAVACIALGSLLIVGCGMERDAVEWDLSQSHTRADVGWEGELTAKMLERGPVDSITLPGGKVWTGSEDIYLAREGELLTDLTLKYRPMAVGEAASLARDLAEEWGVDGGGEIEGWEAGAEVAVDGHRPDDIDRVDIGAGSEPLGGDGGPVPSLQLAYSFDDDLPARVQLTFFWAPPR